MVENKTSNDHIEFGTADNNVDPVHMDEDKLYDEEINIELNNNLHYGTDEIYLTVEEADDDIEQNVHYDSNQEKTETYQCLQCDKTF